MGVRRRCRNANVTQLRRAERRCRDDIAGAPHTERVQMTILAKLYVAISLTALATVVACTSDASSTTSAAPQCVVISGDGGPSCGEVVNQCVSADQSACYFLVGSNRIDCASCSQSDLSACQTKLDAACPYAATCQASATLCPGTAVTVCSNGNSTCYFTVGANRIDCASCSDKDVRACSDKAQAACPDAGSTH